MSTKIYIFLFLINFQAKRKTAGCLASIEKILKFPVFYPISLKFHMDSSLTIWQLLFLAQLFARKNFTNKVDSALFSAQKNTQNGGHFWFPQINLIVCFTSVPNDTQKAEGTFCRVGGTPPFLTKIVRKRTSCSELFWECAKTPSTLVQFWYIWRNFWEYTFIYHHQKFPVSQESVEILRNVSFDVLIAIFSFRSTMTSTL